MMAGNTLPQCWACSEMTLHWMHWSRIRSLSFVLARISSCFLSASGPTLSLKCTIHSTKWDHIFWRYVLKVSSIWNTSKTYFVLLHSRAQWLNGAITGLVASTTAVTMQWRDFSRKSASFTWFTTSGVSVLHWLRGSKHIHWCILCSRIRRPG